MSLADELFSLLDSTGTDNKGNSEHKRSKSGHRVQSYLTEQDERRNSSSGGSPQVRRSSQERGRHEETCSAGRYSDRHGAGNYNRNDYGHQKCDIERRKNDANEIVPIGSEVTGGRRYERRSGSASSQQEPHNVGDGEHRRDRSEDTLHPSRKLNEYGKQPSRNVNFVEECCKKVHRDGHRTKDYPRTDNNTQKFGEGNIRHSYELHNDSSRKNSQPDRKHGESKSTQNYVGEPGKYENDNRKTVKKSPKVDEITDNVPFKLINYRKLEDLVNSTPMELVVALANRHSGFENRLKEKLSPGFVILIVKALAKLCMASFHENKVGILSQACEADFLNQVSDYLKTLPFEEDGNLQSRTDEFLLNLLVLYRTTMELLPDKACDKLPNMLETMKRAISCIETCQAKKFPDALIEGLLDLDCRLKVRVSEREIRHQKPVTSSSTPREKTPPDNFREINIYPTSEDILNTDAVFVRPNIVKGGYNGVEHYLDVQFRLLREDFVCPLRDGISDYMSKTIVDGRCIKKINNVRVYRKVHFIAPKVVNSVVAVEVCFDSSNRCSKVRWEHNKQFIFGSLLCFTKDNFTNIIFGTVVERNVERLKKGFITVEIHQVDQLNEGIFYSEFIMAESEVYFDPYHHVLKALQKLEANIFPMRQYIVDVDVKSTPPVYVQSQPDFQYNIDGHNVAVLDDATWPSAEELHLDDSQYRAFKSALTKEFVVIQGPPGTGKTFIGLKIAEVLLRNSPIWNASNKPILVVCYTNHALDQFLEGLLEHTTNIVRVGGQSKSEVLSEFNLRERRRKNVQSTDTIMLMRDLHNKMSCVMWNIKYIQVDLEAINSGKGVISLHTLKVGLLTHHLSNFFASDGKIDDEIFLEWLEIGMRYCDEPQFPNAGQSAKSSIATETTETEFPEIEGDPNEGMWQYAFDDPIDFVDAINITPHVKFALVLDDLKKDISVLYQKQSQMNIAQDPDVRKKGFELNREIQEYHKCMNYWQNFVQSSDHCDEETVERLLLSENLWELSPNERWLIYHYWVSVLKKRLLDDLRNLDHDIRQSTKRYTEVKHVGDLQVMKNALVIGITTSGAARLQLLLQALKPRIVIVEEAAEIMEPHIVVSLTSDCQHLILIGDHKQLRPNIVSFKLAKDYNFDISLFERMLMNGMNCETLNVQHRMRPEITKLIVPTIYPELHNHESVMKYKSVEGSTKSLYFVTHNNPEDEVEDNLQSRKNIHEAKFLVALARHLILQGYSPEQITMLTAYKGQMFFMRSEAKYYSSLKGMKITVIDNYQGEENDIVLLSLVRSNRGAVIGFLKMENRVCVALSRAKKGFFIIGNMDNLTRSSTIWPRIKETLERQEAIGSHLTLRCQLHTAQFTRVACAEDFHNVPEGGCCLPCNSVMGCGHMCKSVCHVLNREHTDYKCLEPCRRVPENCPVEHICLKQCWERCDECMTLVEKVLLCGHVLNLPCYVDSEKHKCMERVTVTLPDCEHEVAKPCYIDVKHFRCNHPCEDRLPCGHSCEDVCHFRSDPEHSEFKCYKPCARKNAGCSMDHPCQRRCYEDCIICNVLVRKKLPGCNHEHIMECSVDSATVQCNRKCQKELDCGHPCLKKCFEPCGGCRVKVKKMILSCGHDVELECWQPAAPSTCKHRCEKLLPCGHKCKELCSAPCTQCCREPMPSKVIPACNHTVEVPCFERNADLDPYSDYLLSQCSVPCGTILDCGHRCCGTCGQCLQGRIHMACLEKCGKVQICGHRCNVPCSVSCPPCNRKCRLFRCSHSHCSNKCGEQCTPCMEQCGWKCEHMRCTKKCHEICNRQPCMEPCKNILNCSHPCIGFCGESCPPLCRICDSEQVTTIFFGYEQDEDARFVYLEDCHHVLESQGFEQWMKLSDSEIKMKVCPVCTTPITKTQRYLNIVKKIYADVSKVKRKVYGDLKTCSMQRSDISKQLKATVNAFGLVLDKKHLQVFISVYCKLENELKGVKIKRKGTYSTVDMAMVQIQVQVLNDMAKTVNLVSKSLNDTSKKKLSLFLHMLLRVLDSRERKISDQEVEDMKLELRRLHRVSQLLVLESEPTFQANGNTESVAAPHREASMLARSIDKYNDSQDERFKSVLEQLKKALKSSLALTDKARKEIVKAMGLKQGHWYKCPNGHPYVITECGGAMQVGKCNDCGAAIGGNSHRLLASNAVATEMDGATRPAYP